MREHVSRNQTTYNILLSVNFQSKCSFFKVNAGQSHLFLKKD